MIPSHEWWNSLHNYGFTIFPAQIFFYLAAISLPIIFFRRPGQTADRVIKGCMAFAFCWIGIIFFLLLGQKLPAHIAQCFLFLSISVLFIVDLFTGNSQFRIPVKRWQRNATMAGFALILAGYPLFALLQNRPLSKWIIPGTFPCPTTALALVFMTTSFLPKRRWLYLLTMSLLLIWAIPFPIMFQIPKFGVYEDSIMLATGVYGLIMLMVNSRTNSG
jgi:hypothetical protein